MTAEGTVPTVGTHAYIDTELSFEKDPAELGVPGSLDVDTHQTAPRTTDRRETSSPCWESLLLEYILLMKTEYKVLMATPLADRRISLRIRDPGG